jgi:hypothetical protein
MNPHTESQPPTNSSADVSVFAGVLAVVVALIGLVFSGSARQWWELAAALIAIFGLGIGFSGFTVARLGAPKMGLALAGMIGNLVALVAAVAFFFV